MEVQASFEALGCTSKCPGNPANFGEYLTSTSQARESLWFFSAVISSFVGPCRYNCCKHVSIGPFYTFTLVFHASIGPWLSPEFPPD